MGRSIPLRLAISCAALLLCAPAPLVAGSGYAPVPPPAKLGPAEKAQLKAALKEAKAKSARKAHADAAAAWERAATLQPSLMKALVEGGWEALQAGDLARAERLTKKALGFAIDVKLRGAAEYNLGIIAERRGDKPGAIAAYQRSLGARHTRAAREALGRLDPAAAAAADPVKPKRLAGPFRSLEEWCAKQSPPPEGACPSDRGPFEGKRARARGTGPWKEARVFGDENSGDCQIGLRTARGWYVSDSFWCDEPSHLEQSVVELAFRDVVPGGAPELILRRTDETSARESIEWEDEDGNTAPGMALMTTGCEAHMTLCGLGADETPSCFSLQTAFADHEACSDDPPWKWQLAVDFGTPGQIDITGKGKLSVDEKALTGKRPFSF
jgi:hypothetical protein